MIPLHTKGTPHNISERIIGKVVFQDSKISDQILVTADHNLPSLAVFLKARLTTSSSDLANYPDTPAVTSLKSIEQYSPGDILLIHPSGLVNTLFRANSTHNTLFTTDQCNSNCLMCSQPPKQIDDILYHYQINSSLIALLPKDLADLGITGGEPTLMGALFFDLLRQSIFTLPQTNVHVLTNGRAFSTYDYAAEFNSFDHSRITLGIPLYSDHDQSHDYIVQARGAFNETITGLYQLASLGVRIEIRIVIHKISVTRLFKLARYIFHNLPFVEHVAFMGLEFTGYTPYHSDLLWQEPSEYMPELAEAVRYLDRMGMRVSLYNFPLCVLPTNVWEFARRSISDWKQTYIAACQTCSLREECGGVFATSKKLTSQIRPFTVS